MYKLPLKDRLTISRRTRAGKARSRAQGRHQGGHVPTGYRLGPDDRLVREPREQSVIAVARALRESGLTYRQVSAALARAGQLSRAGTPSLRYSPRSWLPII